MLMNLPRLLVYGAILAGLALVLLWYSASQQGLPQPCRDGESALQGGDYSAAIDHLLLCIESGELDDKTLAEVYHVLGQAYFAKGQYFQAIDDWTTAIELVPNHAWSYNNRCWAYGLQRRPEDALKDCNQALRLLPNQPQILDSRAFAHWQLGDFDSARADLARARQVDGKLPTAEERFVEFEALLAGT